MSEDPDSMIDNDRMKPVLRDGVWVCPFTGIPIGWSAFSLEPADFRARVNRLFPRPDLDEPGEQ